MPASADRKHFDTGLSFNEYLIGILESTDMTVHYR